LSASEGPTPVTIYGKTYHLRGDGDPRYLHALAKEVDRRMRDVDTLKVAILAALNLTDDCMQARSVPASSDVEADLGRLAARIDEVLADPGCRPHRAEAGRSDGHA
jgi:cell division protein ZapA (FtsZ GTPase activity inhibitor)